MDAVVNRSGPKGKVFLVGAGPGSPDLLTVRALRLLSDADVLVYDRLVSEDILALVPPGVTRISVGKSAGQHTVPQIEINRMLVALAESNRIVVRLKGGDPFVFGRGSEEAVALSRAAIPFEVVPGITAATACSTYAGIPLTHRGVSRGFRVVTGHLLEDGQLDLDWRSLADPQCTLVIYMGLGTLPIVARRLIGAGLPGSLPAAAIENGTTRYQRVVRGTLETLPSLLLAQSFTSPTLLIIGHCVTLADEIQWYPENNESLDPLQPLVALSRG